MTAVSLIITGNYGNERLMFDPAHPPADNSLLPIEGFWPDEKAFATYHAIVFYAVQDDGYHVLRLTIDKEKITEVKREGLVRDDLDFYWGTLVITINPIVTSATVAWEKASASDSAPEKDLYCLVIGPDAERMLEYNHTKRISRQQDKLRNELIALDKGCVLTGETTLGALQATHIVEVKDLGIDYRSNAVLMRADLHALYDRGYFTITSTGEVVVNRADQLSSPYLSLLKLARISPAVVNRIAKSLECKATLQK